ncbi:MAG: FecR domain-containing protein [Bacteroidota bacterium]|nr:FecR domain-containing protein [Bacteroidota bacterium]
MKEETFKNMDEGAYRVAYLIAGYIRGTLSESEHDELDQWVEASDDNMLLFEELTDEKNIEANLEWMNKIKVEESLQSTKKKINFIPEYPITKKWIFSAAASVILLVAAFGIYKIINNKPSRQTSIAKIEQAGIEPGSNQATLTLSDGSVVDLVSASGGFIKRDHGTIIEMPKEGEIVYKDSGNPIAANYNILATPKGGQYEVQLPDGSRVWLNAASSLKYPTVFSTSERLVELKGEGYFEVTKDKNKPFKVKLADGSEVKVLGTHFNIMAYENERYKDVTLLQGSVEILKGNIVQKLSPGQQGRINSSKIILVSSADTSQVTGWKNGQFIFRDAEIQSIMRQVARWYNVDIKYEVTKTPHFNATISRKEPLLKLLNIFEETNEVHFKVQNKTIYVLP